MKISSKDLLESILKLEINDIEYFNLERNGDNINVKRKHFDLNLNTDIGRIQVEVNSLVIGVTFVQETWINISIIP